MQWVISGANRGIGLEFVRQLAARGDRVDATARNPADAVALRELADSSEGRVRVFACDIGDESSVRSFAAARGESPIDILVNNAGIMGAMSSLQELDMADATRTFEVNALGPLRLSRALLPAMLRGETRKILHITSGMGSITDNTSGGAYGYRMSKAALNMGNKSMSLDLHAQKVVCVVMNPGWVQTDMGGSGAPTPVDVSVSTMIARIEAATLEHSGQFFDLKGGELPY